MGVVYSPEEVRAGYVAKCGDHVTLGRLMLDAISAGDPLVAGIVYGSTAVGSATERSDVDVLCIYADGKRIEAIHTLRQIEEKAKADGIFAKTEVHFEPSVPLRKIGQSGEGDYLPHFVRVQADYPQWSVNNPVKYLDTTSVSNSDLLRDVTGFMAAKTEKFSRAYMGEMDYKALQRAYELPVAIGRKVQQLSNLWNTIHPTEDKHRMSRTGIEILQSLRGDTHVLAALTAQTELNFADREYTSELFKVLETAEVINYGTYLDRHKDRVFENALRLSEAWRYILENL